MIFGYTLGEWIVILAPIIIMALVVRDEILYRRYMRNFKPNYTWFEDHPMDPHAADAARLKRLREELEKERE